MSKTGPLTNQSFQTGPASGPLVKLTTLVATSGEGAVYRTSRSGYVAKIYAKPEASHFRKLEIMVANPPRDPAAPAISIAWPTAILSRKKGSPAGFMMPEIVNAKRPTILYVPKTRLLDASGVDWFYLHSAALNVARLFKAIHELGCVIGDVKPENLLVNASMQICAIDTDSFQVVDQKTKTVYRCPVGTGDYTPPELMGQDFLMVDRTPAHDLFGLAALLYLFLFGKHPYSGGILPDSLAGLETTERISRGLWQWSRANPLKPHRGSIPIDIVHPELMSLFRRCFDRGAQRPDMRPTAKEWERALEIAIDDLVWCGSGTLHVHASHRPCPWCEMARGGIDYFPTKSGLSSSSFTYVIQRLDRYAANGEVEKAAALLERYARLKSDPRATKARAATQKQAAALARIATLRDQLARAGRDDDAAIAVVTKAKRDVLALAEKDPELAARITRLKTLAVALAEVEAAILASIPKGGLFSAAAEAAVVEAVRRSMEILRTSPSTFPRFAQRVREAKERVDALANLNAAEAGGSPVTLAEVVERQGARLAEIAELAPRRAEFDQILSLGRTLAAFVVAASRKNADPEAVCRAWEAHPELATATAATQPLAALADRSPEQAYREFAAARDALRALVDTLSAHAPTGRAPTPAGLAACRQAVLDHVGAHGPIPATSPIARRIGVLENLDRAVATVRAIAAQGQAEYLALARAWRAREGEIALEGELAAAVNAAQAQLTAAEQFVRLAGEQGVEEAALVRCWNEAGLDHPSTSSAILDGVALAERYTLATRRIEAASVMKTAIGKADESGRLTRADENAVVSAWDGTPTLQEWRSACDEFGPRVERARLRLARLDALSDAIAAGDFEAIASAWGDDRLLEGLVEAQTHADGARRAVEAAGVAAAVAAELRGPLGDESRALEVMSRLITEGGPSVLSAPWSVLGTRSLADVHRDLGSRAAFRRLLATCDSRSAQALFALAQAWDPEFGRADANLQSAPMLVEALTLAQRWADIQTAARARDDTTVARLWTDERVEAAPDFGEAAAEVVAALKRYLDTAPRFAAHRLGGVTANPDGSVLLRFHWKDPTVSHAQVLVGDRTAPEAMRARTIVRHLVTKVNFEAAGGVTVASPGRMIVALVLPSFVVRGAILNASEGVMIEENSRRTLRYRLTSGGKRRKSQTIELRADRPIELPRLRLRVDAGGGQGEFVISLDPIRLGSDGRILVPLPDRSGLFKIKRPVFLEPEVVEDGAWLQILHPDPTDRKMVVR